MPLMYSSVLLHLHGVDFTRCYAYLQNDHISCSFCGVSWPMTLLLLCPRQASLPCNIHGCIAQKRKPILKPHSTWKQDWLHNNGLPYSNLGKCGHGQNQHGCFVSMNFVESSSVTLLYIIYDLYLNKNWSLRTKTLLFLCICEATEKYSHQSNRTWKYTAPEKPEWSPMLLHGCLFLPFLLDRKTAKAHQSDRFTSARYLFQRQYLCPVRRDGSWHQIFTRKI